MELYEQICAHLDGLGITYRRLQHEAVTSSAEAAAARGVDLHSGAKALVVKAKDEFCMFVIPGDAHLDWKAVKRQVGSKSARFATEDELLAKTGLIKGSVPPLGNLLGLMVYIDNEVLAQDLVRFNGGSLEHSIEMPGARLEEAAAALSGWFAD